MLARGNIHRTVYLDVSSSTKHLELISLAKYIHYEVELNCKRLDATDDHGPLALQVELSRSMAKLIRRPDVFDQLTVNGKKDEVYANIRHNSDHNSPVTGN